MTCKTQIEREKHWSNILVYGNCWNCGMTTEEAKKESKFMPQVSEEPKKPEFLMTEEELAENEWDFNQQLKLD